MNLAQAREAIEEFVADILDNGDDDQLFASGYLQGHLDLILSRCEDAGAQFIQFMDEMEQSLAQAFAQNELAQRDRLLVEECWQALQAKLAA